MPAVQGLHSLALSNLAYGMDTSVSIEMLNIYTYQGAQKRYWFILSPKVKAQCQGHVTAGTVISPDPLYISLYTATHILNRSLLQIEIPGIKIIRQVLGFGISDNIMRELSIVQRQQVW